jgi:hypothetical protein
MAASGGGPEHWLLDRARAERTTRIDRRRNVLSTSCGWGFVACAAVAMGYGLWTLYGSGGRLASLDAMRPIEAPVVLDPSMNPLRAVLHAAYAPVGSTRLRYEVELVDSAGTSVWEKRGALGNKDDEASIVMTHTSLADFDVARPGTHLVRVRFTDSSMDDLRQATLELRRNVVRVDTRITWGFGLAALACLAASLLGSRRQPWPRAPEIDERRTAA